MKIPETELDAWLGDARHDLSGPQRAGLLRFANGRADRGHNLEAQDRFMSVVVQSLLASNARAFTPS